MGLTDTLAWGTFRATFSNPQTLLQTIGPAFGQAVQTNSVATVFRHPQTLLQAIGATFGQAIQADTVATVFRHPQTLLQAISATFGQAIQADTVAAVFRHPQALLQAIGTTFGQAIQANSVAAVFRHSQALLQTIGATFGKAIRTGTFSTICGDTQAFLQALGTTFGQRTVAKANYGFHAAVFAFAQQRLRGVLWQGESASRQAGQEQRGDNLLFHFRLLVRAVSEYGAHVTYKNLIKKCSRDMVIIDVIDSWFLPI
jgi:antitoxin component of MazEF toxin-antitoxin module